MTDTELLRIVIKSLNIRLDVEVDGDDFVSNIIVADDWGYLKCSEALALKKFIEREE